MVKKRTLSYMLIFFWNRLASVYCKMRIGDNRQRTINLTIIGALLFFISGASGQNTTIVFNTKQNSTIAVSKEIDNTFNHTLTDKINTDATGNYMYSWDVNDFQFVNYTFYDGGNAFFPIKEGTHLTIIYKGDNQFEFEGTDKAEVEFYTNGYKKDIARPFIESLFGFPAESGFEDFSLMIEKHYSILANTLDSLVAEKMISPKFSDIVKNEFYIITTCIAIEIYQTRYLKDAATKVNEQDSITVENLINGILDKISPMIDSGDILKYSPGNSALNIFYTNKYRHLNDKEKGELLVGNTWANYLQPHKFGYLLVPEKLQYKLLSRELLENYENGVIEGNSELLGYISEIRPQNAFLPYIKEKRNELLASMNADYTGIKYIEDTINTLEDLSRIDALDQKILYIDIWATWCAPCIAEFKHKDEVHELLSNYKNIIPVYISIDEDGNDIVWRQKTKAFNLNGYHLRANKALVTDINKELYQGKGIGIPRYILLDKDGNILEENLPRPSNIDKLKQELDKHF